MAIHFDSGTCPTVKMRSVVIYLHSNRSRLKTNFEKSEDLCKSAQHAPL